MDLITLPAHPGPRRVAWSPIDFGGTLNSPLGGRAQRVNRLGNRWRCEVEIPTLMPHQAREWSAALVRGLSHGVRWDVRQVSFDPGITGNPVVNGAGQVGDALAADGFHPHYLASVGQFFSILTGGRRYLHQVATNMRADASGAFAALPIEPLLRVSPADGAVLEFGRPIIEGLLADAPSWSNDPDRLSRGFTFAIEEAE